MLLTDCCCTCRGDKCQAQIVIATHGKLKNWLARDFIPLNHMKILVFDEADQMLAVSPSLRPAAGMPKAGGEPLHKEMHELLLACKMLVKMACVPACCCQPCLLCAK